MRRFLPLLAVLLLLSGCSRASPADAAEALRQEYDGLRDLNLVATVTADYGERVYEFKLRLGYGDGQWTVEVLAPEAIAGITARCAEDALRLEYDGVILDTGDLSSAGLSPMNALPLIVRAWQSGHLSEALYEGTGEERLSMLLTVNDETQVLTVFDTATHLPLRAEVTVNGYTAIFCEFEDVTLH